MNLLTLRLLNWPTENNVFLFPGMNATTMCTSELLLSHFGSWPAFFFDCLPGICQA